MSDRIEVENELTISIEEGTTGDIVIDVPISYPLAGKSFLFEVWDAYKNPIITKTSPATITVVNQQLTIPMLIADTQNQIGTHHWRLRALETGLVNTIGKGPFIIYL